MSLPSTRASTLCVVDSSKRLDLDPKFETVENAHAAGKPLLERAPEAALARPSFESSKSAIIFFRILVTSEGNKNPWEYLNIQISNYIIWK
jgi:hypothetical protein